MVKIINGSKLASMPFPKIQKACNIHAVAAVAAKKTGKEEVYLRHCGLLDQCAEIIRKHPDNPRLKRSGTYGPTSSQLRSGS